MRDSLCQGRFTSFAGLLPSRGICHCEDEAIGVSRDLATTLPSFGCLAPFCGVETTLGQSLQKFGVFPESSRIASQMSFSQIVRLISLSALALVAIACANVPPPHEQAAVPFAPIYPPTVTPTPTRPAPTATPLPLPTRALTNPTLAVITGVEHAHLAPPPTRLATSTPIARAKPVHDPSALNEYHRGIAYVSHARGEYSSDDSRRSLDELFATGANYISVLVTWYQTDIQSTDIYRADNTPSDEDLKFVIDYAHAHGVKVLLKPQVDLSFDEKHWRGQIAFEDEASWRKWFASYRQFILHYAKFAQENGVEEFSVGTELFEASKRTSDWRAIIRAVRQEYTGLVTYSANHSGEEVHVNFWDDLDFIGINVFYHLANYRTPNFYQVMQGWTQPVMTLTEVHNRFPNKPMIFTEVGYQSMDLASVWPWNWQRQGEVDLDEQALLYYALFQMWWHNPYLPWFRGMFIWSWTTDPDQGGPDSSDYTPHNKP